MATASSGLPLDVLRQERARITKELASLEERYERERGMLTDYGQHLDALLAMRAGHKASPANKPKAASDGMSRMEMIRQVLGQKRVEMSIPELKQAVVGRFHVEPDELKNMSQWLYKAVDKKQGFYKGKDNKFGLSSWRQKSQPKKAAAKKSAA